MGPYLLAGRYRLDRVIGSGAMGTVWQGFDTELTRPVAIKELRLPGTIDDREARELMARVMIEARSAARIAHPNVVTVHDILSEDGKPWLVMQLVHGQTLEQQLRAGPLTVTRTAAVGLAVVEALAAAHALGIVHRDVKPANVLIDGEGKVLLTDFSIAKVTGPPGLTRSSDVWGTPGYIAPELVKNWSPGPWSDLFGLGVLLFRAVEGYGPFDRSDPHAALIASVTEPHPEPVRAGPLTPVINGLLEKDPTVRWTAPATRSALMAIASGEPGPAFSRPAAPVPRGAPPPVPRPQPEPLSDRPPRPASPPGPVPPADSPWPPQPPGPAQPRPRKPGVRTVSVAVTATVTVTLAVTLALTLNGSHSSSSSVSPGSSTAAIGPATGSATATQTASSTASASVTPSASAAVTGSWGKTNGPLTLIVSKVEVVGGILRIHAKAVNASSAALDLPLDGNCVATDNTGATYDADPYSPWTSEVPPGQFVTGVINFNGAVAAGATTLTMSFAVVYGPTAPPAITVSGIPVPS